MPQQMEKMACMCPLHAIAAGFIETARPGRYTVTNRFDVAQPVRPARAHGKRAAENRKNKEETI